ncbi:phosphodiesterase [Desulfocurvus sp. DL9XJH121]
MLIAQISDSHLTATGTACGVADTAGALARAVNWLNALDPAPDVVVLTGDVADSGQPEGYEAAAGILGGLDAPCLALPGNHDQRARMRSGLAALPGACGRGPGGRIQFAEDAGGVRLVGLDTLVPGRPGGALDAGALDWLRGALDHAGPVMLFMHHPPFAVGVPGMDLAFGGSGELAAVVRGAGNVLAVCCGHLHLPVATRFAGAQACTAPSVGMPLHLDLATDGPPQFMTEPPGLALHLAGPGQGGWRVATHFPLVPGGGFEFAGPHPFTDSALPV